MRLRVLDLNAWHGLYARTWWKAERLETAEEKEARTLLLIEAVRELDPDVLTLQECFPQPSFTTRLAEALGHDHVAVVSNAGLRLLGTGFPAGIDTGEGVSVLARRGLGLRSIGTRALSGSSLTFTSGVASFQLFQRRMAVAGEIRAGDRRVAVVSAHVRYEFATLEAFEASWRALRQEACVEGDPPPPLVRSVRANMDVRDRELDMLADWLGQIAPPEEAVVVGADLNVDQGSPQVERFVARTGAVSALAAVGETRPTWDPARNPNVLKSAAYEYLDGSTKSVASLVVAHHDRLPQGPDHLLLSPALGRDALVSASLALDSPRGGILVSDHFGVLATIDL